MFCFIFALFLVFSTQFYSDVTISATEIDLLIFQPVGLQLPFLKSPWDKVHSRISWLLVPALLLQPCCLDSVHPTIWCQVSSHNLGWPSRTYSVETDSPGGWDPVPNEACQAGGIVVWGLKGHSIFFWSTVLPSSGSYVPSKSPCSSWNSSAVEMGGGSLMVVTGSWEQNLYKWDQCPFKKTGELHSLPSEGKVRYHLQAQREVSQVLSLVAFLCLLFERSSLWYSVVVARLKEEELLCAQSPYSADPNFCSHVTDSNAFLFIFEINRSPSFFWVTGLGCFLKPTCVSSRVCLWVQQNSKHSRCNSKMLVLEAGKLKFNEVCVHVCVCLRARTHNWMYQDSQWSWDT